jgi:pilus assembly protein Flp/PilA
MKPDAGRKPRRKGESADEIAASPFSRNPVYQLHFSKGHIMDKLLSSIRSFAVEDDGAQVVEYALIIAVVSLGLIILLMGTNGLDFTQFINRVNACLTGPTCV